MNQIHTKTEKDLAKKRREYLKRKRFATLVAAVAGIFGAWLLLMAVGTAVFLPFWNILVLFMVLCAIYCFKRSRSLAEKARSIPYVPPVHEQIASLPADEVLLRGSVQPAAQPEELLRAAQRGEVEPSEELLRADQGRA